MKKLVRSLVRLLLSVLLSISLAIPAAAQSAVLTEEKVQLSLPGIKGPIRLLFVSDLHLISPKELQKGAPILPEKIDELKSRFQLFANELGPSSDYWQQLCPALDSYGADAILFGGDMLDHFSPDSFEELAQGLAGLTTPWLYIRADHDVGNWFLDPSPSPRQIRPVEKALDGNPRINSLEVKGVRIVGISCSTSQFTRKMVEKAADLISTDQPVILFTHVPFRSEVDPSLSEMSRQSWDGRDLTWGEGAYYPPNKNTQKLIDLITGEDSPVKAVFAGHLHFSWDGYLTPSVREHVFDAAYKGHIGVIDITP